VKAQNSIVKSEKPQTFSSAITGQALQNLIRKSVPNASAAARFTGSLISAVAATPALQKCKPATVVAAALRGEGMGLTLGREYHLIPFADSCAYVIGYKGLLALLIASGEVADADCIEVREGEYVGRDPRTKRPKFDFGVYETDEEAEKHEVIGYMAYVEMKSGYFRSEYMTIAEILNHAKSYSKSFDIEKYQKLVNGEYTPQEAEKIKTSSPWYSAPQTMFRKTVIRRLLNSGYVRLANSAAINEALAEDNAAEDGLIPDLTLNVDSSTGEVVEAEAVEVADAPQDVENTSKVTRKSKTSNDTPTVEYDSVDAENEASGSFFD